MKERVDELSKREPYFDELKQEEQIERLRKVVEYLIARESRLTILVGELNMKMREHQHNRQGEVVMPIDRVNYPEHCGGSYSHKLKLSQDDKRNK